SRQTSARRAAMVIRRPGACSPTDSASPGRWRHEMQFSTRIRRRMIDMPDSARRRKGIRAGIVAIVFGILSAIFLYYQDLNSVDYFRISSASQGAILHAVIWCTIGAGIILWALSDHPDHRE